MCKVMRFALPTADADNYSAYEIETDLAAFETARARYSVADVAEDDEHEACAAPSLQLHYYRDSHTQ